MELRQMTPEQAYEVYHTQAFLQAFPWAERRPWRSIWALLQKNAYECYGGYDAQGALLCLSLIHIWSMQPPTMRRRSMWQAGSRWA